MSAINNCSAKVYQEGKEVALLENVTIKFIPAPIVPAPFPQPEGTCEVWGNITSANHLKCTEIMTIDFEIQSGEKLTGDFYLKPLSTFDGKRYVFYFQLSGALTIET